MNTDHSNHHHEYGHHGHDHLDHGHGSHEQLKSRYEQAFSRFDLHLHDEIVQEEVKTLLARHQAENNTSEVLRFLLGTIELTSLKVTDNEDNILQMVERVNSFVNDNPALPHPAGICVYPRFVSIVSTSLSCVEPPLSVIEIFHCSS